MSVQPAEWYDEVLVEQGSPAMLPLDDSPWLSVYTEIARWIDPHEEVVDLGCGTGRFLELLYRNGHYARVTGIDWSQAAIAEAESYVSPPPEAEISFEQIDLHDWRADPLRAGNTVYVSLEVLEHLEDDLRLVQRVPPGHRLLFSVPNFDSPAHVRVFTSLSAIWARYSPFLHFRRWVMVGSDRQGIHIFETRRRGDSW